MRTFLPVQSSTIVRIMIVQLTTCLLWVPGLCAAQDVATPEVSAATATQQTDKPLHADRLLDRTHVVEVEIEMADDDWKALCSQSRDMGAAMSNPTAKPFTWFPGDVTVDGVKIGKVGIRKKGFIGSLDSVRPSLKIKFDKYVADQHPIDGLEQLTLNNNKQDRSLLSQNMTYSLFRKAGVHAPRCTFATVTVNGKYLGIYSHVESVRSEFLQNEYGDALGKLYEGTLSDFYPKALGNLEAKNTPAEEGRSAALALATLFSSPEPLTMEIVEQHLDVDNFLTFWAMESLLGFWDGYTQNQNNYFAYQDAKSSKWYFMPWGADSCFTERGPFARMGGAQTASVRAESIISNRLYHIDGMPARYRKAMEKLLKETWQEEELVEEIGRLNALIFNDLNEQQLDSLDAAKDVIEFIEDRREAIEDEFQNHWPIEISKRLRKPVYMVNVGQANGSFDTQWEAESEAPGDETMNVQLAGSDVTMKSVVTSVEMQQGGGFRFGGGGNRTPTVQLKFTCDVEQGESFTITLLIPKAKFTATPNKIPVTGILLPNQRGGGFGGMFKTIKGDLILEAAGTEANAAVKGTFDVGFTEMRGGMFERFRRR